MGLNEALNIYKKWNPFIKLPNSYVEYENYYVFFINSEEAFDGAVAVDKNEKKCINYTPILLTVEELDNPINR